MPKPAPAKGPDRGRCEANRAIDGARCRMPIASTSDGPWCGKHGQQRKLEAARITPKPRKNQAKGAVNARVKAIQDNTEGKTKNGGVSKGDRAWSDYQEEQGLLSDVHDQELIKQGILRRFDGDPMDIILNYDSFWRLPLPERRCKHKAFVRDQTGHYIIDKDGNKLRRACSRPAIRGADVCYNHGGGIPAVKQKAQMRLLQAADEMISNLLHIATNPMMDGKVRVQAINSALDRAGIRGGVEVDITLPQWQKGLKELFEKNGRLTPEIKNVIDGEVIEDE